ncbi:nucleoside deaminase [Pelagibacterium montanilacus]|uniref:nucleoside deaminase n=1 Tax=Pelagibacterium montanilacus TaxID=2185280 RepID=UPI0019D0E875|nr:nucleoside deaminase [Pelagibacterium montanilacus]
MSTGFKPMEMAFALAEQAALTGEVPVGAVITLEGRLVASERNRMRALRDPTAHAEMLAIRSALDKIGSGRLAQCDLYVTLEPCTMCAAAISHVRLRRLYYGAEDAKGGAVDNGVRFFAQPTCHHAPEVIGGLSGARAGEMLRAFFAGRR